MKVGISIIDFTYYNRFIQAVGSYKSCWLCQIGVSGFALWILIFADIKNRLRQIRHNLFLFCIIIRNLEVIIYTGSSLTIRCKMAY